MSVEVNPEINLFDHFQGATLTYFCHLFLNLINFVSAAADYNGLRPPMPVPFVREVRISPRGTLFCRAWLAQQLAFKASD
ncbi:MAG: hypothetical protein WStaPseu_19780 [Shewanella algae]